MPATSPRRPEPVQERDSFEDAGHVAGRTMRDFDRWSGFYVRMVRLLNCAKKSTGCANR